MERAEINRRIAAARLGKPHPHRGYKPSAETLEKMRLAGLRQVRHKTGPRPPEWGRAISAGKRLHRLPLAEIAKRYLHGDEELSEILADFPDVPYANPVEAVRRQLIREGYAGKTRRGIGRGQRNFQWKGGRKQAMHYYRRQSYEIAAICLQRPLKIGEVIHHDDETKENNAPENLVVFPSHRAHMRHHQRLLSLQRAGTPVDSIQLAKENDGLRLQRPACLIGWKPDIGLKPLLETLDRRTSHGQGHLSNAQRESHLQ